MLARLATLFIVVSFAELAILILLGRAIDLLPTLAIIVVTGIVGAALAKRQGQKTLQQIQHQLNLGALPGDALIEGVLILISGAFLLTPGLITDTTGMLLLIPPIRRRVRERVKRELTARLERPTVSTFTFFDHVAHGGTGDVIDITPVHDEDSEEPTPNPVAHVEEDRLLH